MSAGILLIDGYNLMHAAGMAQHDYKPGDLLKCRTKLLRYLLGKLSAAEIRNTTIIFDARDPPPDRPAQVVVSGLKVLFANPGGDADVVIQEWLARHSSPTRVTLVSSDRVLQRAARGCRSKFVGSDEFLHDLERRRAPQGRTGSTRAAHSDDSKPAAHLSASDAAHWLKLFGDVRLDALAVVAEDDAKVESLLPRSGTKLKPAATAKAPASTPTKVGSSEPKLADKKTADDLKYWLQVFGEKPDNSIGSSPDELRLADLEKWLKEFQAGNM
jgi:predicted RNA-binding protein with PIN domain